MKLTCKLHTHFICSKCTRSKAQNSVHCIDNENRHLSSHVWPQAINTGNACEYIPVTAGGLRSEMELAEGHFTQTWPKSAFGRECHSHLVLTGHLIHAPNPVGPVAKHNPNRQHETSQNQCFVYSNAIKKMNHKIESINSVHHSKANRNWQ